MKSMTKMSSSWRIVIGLLCAWFFALIYMITTMYPVTDKSELSGVSERMERQLSAALRELDDLKQQNKRLYQLTKQLQMESRVKRNKDDKSTALAVEDKVVDKVADAAAHVKDDPPEFADLSAAPDEPSEAHEMLRRATANTVKEMWMYMSTQLQLLRGHLSSESSSLSRIEDMLIAGIDYKRAALRDLRNMSSLANDWRERESRELSEIAQARIRYVQNPPDCSAAKKLVCSINKGCGYGCQLHHVTYCFLIAHGTNRTMILETHGWRYSSAGWEKYFLPISDTCTDRSGATSKFWGQNVEDAQVIELPIIDSIQPRPPFLPQAIPADLAPRLIRLHGHPFVWWVGQFVKYLLRPQPSLADDMEQVRLKLGFENPIVGIHIRRTDKVNSEAAFHKLDEYMLHVEDYFDELDQQRRHLNKDFEPVRRRIYLASDDPNVISEAKTSYPQYDVISDASFAKSAGLNSRYNDHSLRAIILDIHLLSLTDYLVCTFSSQVCRVAYEIMQTYHLDASDRFRSLDDIYYFGGQFGHNQIAVAAHQAHGSAEIDLEPGDVVGVAGNHWDGFSKGQNRRTGRQGIYPSYKVREKVELAPYPSYPEAMSSELKRLANKQNSKR